MKSKLKFNFGLVVLMFFVVGTFSLGIFSCGNGEDTSTKPSANIEADKPAEPKNTAPTTSKQKKNVPQGWKTYTFEGWSISFPADWSADEDAGIFWHGKGNLDYGRPAISVHTGGTPLMPNQSFEDKINSHMNSKPITKEKFSSSGFSGLKCTWESSGKKYLGIFLEEKVGGGMSIVHFANCRTPAADFDQYKNDFEKILTTYTR